MTIRMPDSVTPVNINMVDAKAAVLGYVDGDWPTARQLPALFPGAKIITLTVAGGGTRADGCDRENGDLTADEAAEWIGLAIKAGQWRPVLYASRDNVPEVLGVLGDAHIAPKQIRILSAHYGAGEHICGPRACGAAFQADGTQWTSTYPGVGGRPVDMSLLAADFFGPAAPPANWVFSPPRELAAVAGHTNVELTWTAPAGPAPEAVRRYQVTIRHLGQDVATYPRDVPKGANPEVHSFGSLQQDTPYMAMVRAVAINGHASTWAVVDFITGAA